MFFSVEFAAGLIVTVKFSPVKLNPKFEASVAVGSLIAVMVKSFVSKVKTSSIIVPHNRDFSLRFTHLFEGTLRINSSVMMLVCNSIYHLN